MFPKIFDSLKTVSTCKKGICIYEYLCYTIECEHKFSIPEGRGNLDYFSFMQQATSTWLKQASLKKLEKKFLKIEKTNGRSKQMKSLPLNNTK